jgi:hypothetical protein
MRLSILHDQHGQIIATAKVGNLKEAGSKFSKVGMVPRKGQGLVEIELTGGLENVPSQDLNNNYRVDLHTAKLVKRK